MLLRDIKRVALILGPLLGLVLISLSLWNTPSTYTALRSKVETIIYKPFSSSPITAPDGTSSSSSKSHKRPPRPPITDSHHEIFSLTSSSTHQHHRPSDSGGSYFPIIFPGYTAFNPSILPHPTLNHTWIVVAQKRRVNPADGSDPDPATDPSVFHVEIGCNAQFRHITHIDGQGKQGRATRTLECVSPPEVLPIAATVPGEGKCPGNLAFMAWNVGPHDARVFYGPEKDAPYIVFGSNGRLACFGMFLQDFRVLVDWKGGMGQQQGFRLATELQRPGRYGVVEKNWFVFWDEEDVMWLHYDLVPERAFARVGSDGAVVGGDGDGGGAAGGGTGRAGRVKEKEKENGKKTVSSNEAAVEEAKVRDRKCVQRYLPRIPKGVPEDIHQATNSLRVTMCERSDKECAANPNSTVIMTIVHHKTYYDYHGEYEPYVVVFRQTKPFELYGISKRPLWIHGRRRESDKRSDMFYVASMNWKERGRLYHGYLDDVVFLGFGIEDHGSGGINVLTSDLLAGLGLCDG